MAKRKPMAAMPDFNNINEAAGVTKESIDKLESEKKQAENWSSSVSRDDQSTYADSEKPSTKNAKQKSRIGRVAPISRSRISKSKICGYL